MKVDKKKKPKGKGCRAFLMVLLILTACGGAGGGDEQSAESIITSCGNSTRADVSITCNVTQDSPEEISACQDDCDSEFSDCKMTGEETGIQDEECEEIYNRCLEGC